MHTNIYTYIHTVKLAQKHRKAHTQANTHGGTLVRAFAHQVLAATLRLSSQESTVAVHVEQNPTLLLLNAPD